MTRAALLVLAGLTLGGGSVDAQLPPWLATPTRTPTRVPTRVVTPTAPPATATPVPVNGPVAISYEVFASVQLGRLSSPAIPTGRYWVTVDGGQPREMRQPAAPGQAARNLDGSTFSFVLAIGQTARIRERLVRADGFEVSVEYTLQPLGVLGNATANAGYPVPASRVAPTPAALLASRRK